ncbi:MAG: hypothetical protein JW904_14045 [Spirochaetales bacterium]|nr:hypothetical protein [Spirochaetales bacterium]
MEDNIHTNGTNEETAVEQEKNENKTTEAAPNKRHDGKLHETNGSLQHLQDDHNHHNHDDAHRLDIKSLSLEEVKGRPLYRVKILSSNETILSILEEGVAVAVQDHVVVTTRYGKDLGFVQCGPCNIDAAEGMEIYPIHRKATESDMSRNAAHHEKEIEAFRLCLEKINEHDLDMKLVATHYLLEEPKILFFFTAENRVDFRELVKDLVSIFKMRIELRQIGVRDEARVLGGVGICGRNFCCHSVTDKLNPVSIKMAKEQNISLNSLKISGPCGRLLCCLGYEYDFYHQEKSCLPDEGKRFVIEKEDYYVSEVNVLTNKITLRGAGGRILSFPVHVFKKNSNGDWIINHGLLEENIEQKL